jgi:16S rRNA processing protein RimM
MSAKEFFERDVEFVECGRLGRPMGIRGETAVFWNNGECPVPVGDELFVAESKEEYKTYRVAALREQGRSCVIRLEGIDSREAAADTTNLTLYVPATKLPPLSDGEYYSYQILGLDVVTEEGRSLGKVVKIFTAGENDIYEVLPDGAKKGSEILIPVIEDVVISIDPEAGRVIVRPMDGMLEVNIPKPKG